jgi:hypothetical protein
MTSFAQRLQKDIDNLALYFQSKDRVKAGCKQVDLSKPPSGVLIQDGFLSEVEIEAAEAQLKQMQEQRSLKERFLIATKQKSHAEQQFIIDLPGTIAVRLRSKIDNYLGVEAHGNPAPKQEKLPARVIFGPTEEHVDEPKGAAPNHEDEQTTTRHTPKAAYRDGYIAIVYLGGDGALVLGGQNDPGRIQVPVKPGRLVAWPNTSFLHSAHGETRRLIGPLAVIPGDRSAPLWLTVKGAGVIYFLFPIAGLLLAHAIVMLCYGFQGLKTDASSYCPNSWIPIPTSHLITFYLIFTPVWNAIAIAFLSYSKEGEELKCQKFLAFVAVNILLAIGVITNWVLSKDDCRPPTAFVCANASAVIMALINGFISYICREKWIAPLGKCLSLRRKSNRQYQQQRTGVIQAQFVRGANHDQKPEAEVSYYTPRATHEAAQVAVVIDRPGADAAMHTEVHAQQLEEAALECTQQKKESSL